MPFNMHPKNRKGFFMSAIGRARGGEEFDLAMPPLTSQNTKGDRNVSPKGALWHIYTFPPAEQALETLLRYYIAYCITEFLLHKNRIFSIYLRTYRGKA
jgi:hypothetical protein